MKNKTYSIFGAGAAGLYTAWRLLNGETTKEHFKHKQLKEGDTLELYDWGQYDFSAANPGTRAAGARICTWHYDNDKTKSYLELGGMRYSAWDGNNDAASGGHRVVTQVIKELKLDKYSIPFNESVNPLYYLRTKNIYYNDISKTNPAPYNTPHASLPPDDGFNTVEALAVTKTTGPKTRADWCSFYRDGVITEETSPSSVFKKGDLLKNIGYWNLMFDQLGSEGYSYTNDGNGYTSNVINWNSAVAMQANNEFTPGNEYKTLTHGYSSMFNALFDAITDLAAQKGVIFNYQPNTRLHSILEVDKEIQYGIAKRENPNKKFETKTTTAAWLAMPRGAIDLVAQATRYEHHYGVDVLNHHKVQLYLESAVLQPSYKVGMFFDSPWWMASASPKPTFPAPIISYEVTSGVLAALKKENFPPAYLDAMATSKHPLILEKPYAYASDLIGKVEACVKAQLTQQESAQLLTAAERNTIGPTVTDTPIRQVVYFGNNALDKATKPIYGILASYDDEQFTSFWEELEYSTKSTEKTAFSENYQPLIGPRKAPEVMIKMLRQQLAAVHFGPDADYNAVPEPLETRYMDWSLPPFNAGYHAYAAHYDICDVQQKIRKPSQLVPGADADIFIVGEAYSNDQAWVEGAYCTAESVLNDFFGITPIIDDSAYPFICPCV